MTKLTKKDVINMMLEDSAVSANEVYVNYLKNELALIEKKANNKKATKTQEENATIKDEILSVLTTEGATVTDIQSRSAVLANLSNQKVSSLLRQLVESNKVAKTVDKKKSYFALAVA